MRPRLVTVRQYRGNFNMDEIVAVVMIAVIVKLFWLVTGTSPLH